MLSDFEAGVLCKGYVTREDYEEAYRLYVEKMTAAGFIVEKIVDDSGYYVRNYSSRRRNELFSRGDSPASEVSRLDEEERSLSQGCEVGTFQLIPRFSASNPNPAVNSTISSILRFAFPVEHWLGPRQRRQRQQSRSRLVLRALTKLFSVSTEGH